MSAVTQDERIKGCLLGGAVGDALGAPIEFADRHSLPHLPGEGGVRSYLDADGKGRITDDTQMTLFTAEGLIRARIRHATKGICHWPSVVDHAYARWLRTQGRESSRWPEAGDGWLIQRQELHALRAPGNTCLSALMAARAGSAERPANDSKGCGTVMRIAPVGLLEGAGAVERFELGCEIAALTHGHPSGYLAAGFLATVIGSLLDGRPLATGMFEARALLKQWPDHEEVLGCVDAARDRAASVGLPSPEQIDQFGAGWVAEEALGIALWCALASDDFLDGVSAAVTHSGDSDSTGAIAGNLLGAALGVEAIPTELLDALVERQIVEQVADDLCALNEGRLDPEDPTVYERYPGW